MICRSPSLWRTGRVQFNQVLTRPTINQTNCFQVLNEKQLFRNRRMDYCAVYLLRAYGLLCRISTSGVWITVPYIYFGRMDYCAVYLHQAYGLLSGISTSGVWITVPYIYFRRMDYCPVYLLQAYGLLSRISTSGVWITVPYIYFRHTDYCAVYLLHAYGLLFRISTFQCKKYNNFSILLNVWKILMK